MQNTTYKHYKESMESMTEHYYANSEIKALFLVGSAATITARSDADIDAVSVISTAYYEQKKNNRGLKEVYYGKCMYDGGYFNVQYMTRENLEEISQNGTELMRNMFDCALVLFCKEPDLLELVDNIPVQRLKVCQ